MRVSIEPYDPQWTIEFREIQARLQNTLRNTNIVSIEHVGSTSVPGLRAKPVIDIDIIIQQSSFKAVEAALTQAGYTSLGELDVPGRYVFRQPGYGQLDAAHGRDENGRPRQNTYVCIEGCTSLRNHLDVRKVLLEDQKLREEYGAVKARMQEMEFEHIDKYVSRKILVLCKILKAAGWSDEELKPIMQINS